MVRQCASDAKTELVLTLPARHSSLLVEEDRYHHLAFSGNARMGQRDCVERGSRAWLAGSLPSNAIKERMTRGADIERDHVNKAGATDDREMLRRVKYVWNVTDPARGLSALAFGLTTLPPFRSLP